VSDHTTENFTKDQNDVLKSIRISRIILPILIGVVVVIYLLFKQFDPAKFAEINWSSHALFWIGLSFLLLVVRHIAYAARLRILSEGAFSWTKCIELIFIWEFSSAVSPTSVGGSAVALFVLAQEKLAGARVAAIVLYSAVLDTIFFVGTLPFLLLLFGPEIIRPNLLSLDTLDGWGLTFFIAYIFMAIYGAIFYYGLFINPKQLKKLMIWITSFKWLKKYQPKLEKLGEEFIVASQEIKKNGFIFGVKAFIATAIAWSCRFILLNCLIIAFVPTISTDLWTQSALYARLETMFVIMAFSPTPGGAGFAEILFNGFLNDYVTDQTASSLIAIIWRLFTYYTYLFIGVIIIPNWIRKVLIFFFLYVQKKIEIKPTTEAVKEVFLLKILKNASNKVRACLKIGYW